MNKEEYYRDFSDDGIEIPVKLIRYPDPKKIKSAYLFEINNSSEWVPQSVINDISEDNEGNITSVFIEEWYCLEKGFIT
jgi:hypothetical protein